MFALVPLNAGYTVSVRRTRLDAFVLLILVSSRRVTDFYPSRGYTQRNTRDRGITLSLQSGVLILK